MALPARSGGALSLSYFAAGVVALAFGMLHELAIRQPTLYAFGGYGPRPRHSLIAAGAGLSIALWQAWRAPGAISLLPVLLLSSAASALSAAAWFWGARLSDVIWLVALVVPATSGLLGGLLLDAVRNQVWPRIVQLKGTDALLNPLRLVGLLGAMLAAAALASAAGVLRSALLLGVAFGALGGFWCLASGASRREVSAAGAIVLFELGGLFVAQRVLPLGEIRQYPNPVVYGEGTLPDRVVVTSGQDAVELFVAGALTLSSLDGYRYAEALVHPALRAAASRERVLVIERGTGTITREVLRWPDVARVQVLAESTTSVKLARSAHWLRALTGDALAAPRVTLTVAEAAPWLEAHDQQYDAIVADLPDPVDHASAKYFTRYFFWLLGTRLAPEGVLSVQASSPVTSRAAHAAGLAALEAAGLRVLPYIVGVPTLGEWSMLLGSRAPLNFDRPLPRGLRFLNDRSFVAMFEPRARGDVARAPALLHDQVLIGD